MYVFIPLRKNGDVFGNDFVGANKYSPDSFVFRDRGTDHRRETGYRGVAKGAYSAIVVQVSQEKIARRLTVSGKLSVFIAKPDSMIPVKAKPFVCRNINTRAYIYTPLRMNGNVCGNGFIGG